MRRLGEVVVLLLLDLDHFKRINDAYGHSAGDNVLRAVSRAIVSSLREIDKAFRIGGEEFAVLLQGADSAAALVTAERLRIAIAERPIEVDGRLIPVTTSVGIALARDEGEADALLRAADAALYRAKAEGRNRVIMSADEGGTRAAH
jgi:diguanylate cyclase (GGDEF)-like protein